MAKLLRVRGENVVKWPRDYFHVILMKNVTVFCPSLKSLPEAELKDFGLMVLAEISKQASIDWVAGSVLCRSIMKRSMLSKKKNTKCTV